MTHRRLVNPSWQLDLLLEEKDKEVSLGAKSKLTNVAADKQPLPASGLTFRLTQRPAGQAPVVAEVLFEGKEGDKLAAGAARELNAPVALKGFAATLSQHTERQSNLIDVFGAALRELGAELQKSKTKSFSLEVRLREAEARIAQLERLMEAWTRQGQGWIQ